MTRVAVVTGAAHSIGAVTVRGLAARGWALLAVGRCADDPAGSSGLSDHWKDLLRPLEGPSALRGRAAGRHG